MEQLQPNELSDLREANAQLRQKLDALTNSGGSRADDELFNLRNENVELRVSLLRYKALEEDLAAQKVFQKAKKMLVTWMTIGGSVLTLVSVIGLMNINDYAKRLVDEKLKTVSDEKINKTMEDEGQREVAKLLTQKQGAFEDYAHQQIQQLVALMPIGKLSTAVATTDLPSASVSQIDYTSSMTPVRSQGDEGSVVGFALAAALEYQIHKKLGKDVILSPRQIYNETRLIEHTSSIDAGATINDAMEVLTRTGAVPEEAWPYKAGEYAASEPPRVKTAEHYKVGLNRQLSGLSEIKSALQYYGPIVAGITMYRSFQTDAVKKTGMVPLPASGDQVVGGFAICIVGFDDHKRLIKFKHAWGADWGDHGYGYLPYDFVNKNLFGDSWLISL
jgi:C1A family cysteine protease